MIFKDRNPATQGGIFHFSSTIVSGVSPSSAFTMSVLNVDVTINNQTYNADISYGNAKVYINSADGSFILDFSENEGIYNSYFEFNSSIFAAGENTVTIPVNTFHKIDPNYVEDTILWQKGSGMHAV